MLCVGQNMDSESEHEEKSEHEEESEMGCHEPFDLDLSHKYKVNVVKSQAPPFKLLGSSFFKFLSWLKTK